MDWDFFFRAVTDMAFDRDAPDRGLLGSNRVCYLFGEVGTGKSLACARLEALVSKLDKDDNGYKVLVVKICFESLFTRRSLDGKFLDPTVDVSADFFNVLIESIKRRVLNFENSILDNFRSEPTTKDDILERCRILTNLVLYIAKAKIRLVIIFDNIDGLHYRISRLAFFDDIYSSKLERIRQIIAKLSHVFFDPMMAGNLGACILIVARDNVARDIILNPAYPTGRAAEDHMTFWLLPPPATEVISSRLALIDKAAGIISNKMTDSEARQASINSLDIVKRLILESANIDSEALKFIGTLSHHGNRSVVEFVGNLRINHYVDSEVYARLFSDKSHYMERLYIANLRKRYSQAEGHFPNIYLCDMWTGVNKEDEQIRNPHRHSYWLKYLILSLIKKANQGKAGITGKDIIDILVHGGQYDVHFVKLALGSLFSVNEFRCVEFSEAPILAHSEVYRKLVLTSRGEALISKRPAHHSHPYCFDFSYLQLITDDYLMAYPKGIVDKIFVEADLGYTFADQDVFRSGLQNYLLAKIPSVLYFYHLLRQCWYFEEHYFSAELKKLLNEVRPEFESIEESLLVTIGKVLGSLAAQGIRTAKGTLIDGNRVREINRSIRSEVERGQYFDQILTKQLYVTAQSAQ